MPVGNLTDQWFFLCGVDVVAPGNACGVVALGDSLTDGNISTIDAFCRWPDQLARRLVEPAAADGRHEPGARRQPHPARHPRRQRPQALRPRRHRAPGVTHAIVMLGTNDLRNRWAKPEEEVTGEQMIAGLQQMAVRAHGAGIKIIGATLTPFGNETFMANAWNPTRERHRVTVNAWIRESGAFDGVADFDAALRDPEIPTQMRGIGRLRRRPAPERQRLLQDGRRDRPRAVRPIANDWSSGGVGHQSASTAPDGRGGPPSPSHHWTSYLAVLGLRGRDHRAADSDRLLADDQLDWRAPPSGVVGRRAVCLDGGIVPVNLVKVDRVRVSCRPG